MTEPETAIVGQLTRGRAVWKLGERTAVVHLVIGPGEWVITDTDARMTGNPAGFAAGAAPAGPDSRPDERDAGGEGDAGHCAGGVASAVA